MNPINHPNTKDTKIEKSLATRELSTNFGAELMEAAEILEEQRPKDIDMAF